MKKIAEFNEKGVVTRFVDVASNKSLNSKEKLVKEEISEVPEGYELVGPNYRVEKDEVIAYYELQLIDQTTPERLLARIIALEEKAKK